MKPIDASDSSAVVAIRYDAEMRRLFVVYRSGARYRYADVPPEIAEALDRTDSKGTFINVIVKPAFPYEKVETPFERNS